VVQHSQSGWEWGYPGSGCAEFALNILNLFVPPRRETGGENFDETNPYEPIRCFYGECSYFAWMNHQELKRDFIMNLPRAGGTIKGGEIRRWIATRSRDVQFESNGFAAKQSRPIY